MIIDLPKLTRTFRTIDDEHLPGLLRQGIEILERGRDEGAPWADCAAAEIAARRLEREGNHQLATALRMHSVNVAWNRRGATFDPMFRMMIRDVLDEFS